MENRAQRMAIVASASLVAVASLAPNLASSTPLPDQSSGTIPLGSWFQPRADGLAYRVVSACYRDARTRQTGAPALADIYQRYLHRPAEPGGLNSWLRVVVIARNPTPRPYQWFNRSSIEWKVRDANGADIATKQTFLFAATGEDDLGFRLYPGQRLKFIYDIDLAGTAQPTELLSMSWGVHKAGAGATGQTRQEDALVRIPLPPAQLDGKEIPAKYPEPRGTNQMNGRDVRLGTWQLTPEDKIAVNVTEVEDLDPVLGQSVPGGSRMVRVHMSVRNDTGKQWGYFNVSTFELGLVDPEEQTLSRKIEMFEPDGKSAGGYKLEAGEKRDFVYQVTVAVGSPPVKLMVIRGASGNDSFALRYQLGRPGIVVPGPKGKPPAPG